MNVRAIRHFAIVMNRKFNSEFWVACYDIIITSKSVIIPVILNADGRTDGHMYR